MRAALATALLMALPGIAAAEAPRCLCFEHLGPQDKPMPGFCVALQDCAACPGAREDTIVARQTAWASVRAALGPARPAGFGQALGDYIARAPDGSTAGTLDAQAMRKLVETLIATSPQGAGAAPAVLQRLRQRLGPMPE